MHTIGSQSFELTLGKGITIKGLFGEHCLGDAFDHDNHMAQLASELHIENMDQHGAHASAESRIQSSPAVGMSPPLASALSPALDSSHEQAPHRDERAELSQATTASIAHEAHANGNDPQVKDYISREHQVIDLTLEESESSQSEATRNARSQLLKRNFESFVEGSEPIQRTRSRDETTDEDNSHLLDSQETSISARALETRRTAFDSVLHESDSGRWTGLLCTTNNHTHEESELGEE